ncbi:MAG TPA: hypothetical protein VMQ65_00665 [Candidatus Limnocylindria bacterium]|nr:hypothetical protein [Candidatus Limnocylindria bacterium]
MQERTVGSTPDQTRNAAQPDAGGAAGQMTVPTSLVDAVMDVDAAVDDGGLELQEALARMHEELAHIIPSPAEDPGAGSSSSAPVSPEPVSPEHPSTRT